MSTVTIVPIRAFQDNYVWCLRKNSVAVVVDPGDADPVLDYLSAQRLELAAILTTHHHGDHVGGNAKLLSKYNVPVFGPARESIPHVTHRLREGDQIDVPGVGLLLSVLDVPGHTAGHIAYFGQGLLFCGDTLFSCGCGRLFEGTAAQMHASLSKFAALPGDTLVYCAHEYTLSNLRFARAADPGNPAVAEREADARAALAAGNPSLPSTIASELAANPFLRSHAASVIESASRHAGRSLTSPVEVFAALRKWKDGF
ncbi:MAG TPA: hydroxyacylglutathione hydrolase [Burkholderiales bacterium]|nr:hydroxyacylglutathione hydrolase [Burkholderiales bacterium]